MSKIKVERYFNEKFKADEILESIYKDELDKILNDMLSNSNVNL